MSFLRPFVSFGLHGMNKIKKKIRHDVVCYLLRVLTSYIKSIYCLPFGLGRYSYSNISFCSYLYGEFKKKKE